MRWTDVIDHSVNSGGKEDGFGEGEEFLPAGGALLATCPVWCSPVTLIIKSPVDFTVGARTNDVILQPFSVYVR